MKISNDFLPIRTVDRTSLRSKERRRKKAGWWGERRLIFLHLETVQSLLKLISKSSRIESKLLQ